jgi:predicted outer membrane repeat protein
MSFTSWLRNRTRSLARTRKPDAARRAASFRPRLEALEARECPSTLIVTNNLDSGAGSLRADIGKAHNGDTIVFAASLDGQTINLTGGELLVQKNVTIQGPGAGLLTVSGGGHSRVFEVAAKDNVTLSGLTLSQGRSGNGLGGGILNNGTLTVSGCTFSGNVVDGDGGAICNDATMTVNGCTFSGNSAGDIGQGGAIYNLGAATVTSSTFTGNNALDGGAIYNEALGGVYTGKITISGSTFSNNSASGNFTGVIYNYLGSMTLSGCTLSNNTDFVVFNYTSGNTAGPLTINNCTFSGNTAPDNTSISYIFGYWSGTGNTFN